MGLQKYTSTRVTNGGCVCFLARRKPDGGIEYEQHQGNGIRLNGFECRYVSLLNQRSVQRTAGKGLTVLFVLV